MPILLALTMVGTGWAPLRGQAPQSTNPIRLVASRGHAPQLVGGKLRFAGDPTSMVNLTIVGGNEPEEFVLAERQLQLSQLNDGVSIKRLMLLPMNGVFHTAHKTLRIQVEVDGEADQIIGEIRYDVRPPLAADVRLTGVQFPALVTAGEQSSVSFQVVVSPGGDSTREIPLVGHPVALRFGTQNGTTTSGPTGHGQIAFVAMTVPSTGTVPLALSVGSGTPMQQLVEMRRGGPHSIRPDGTLPQRTRVGDIVTFGVVVADSGGNTIPEADVTASLVFDGGRVGTPVPGRTDGSGLARFKMEVIGTVGSAELRVSSGKASMSHPLDLIAGAPTGLRILSNVSARLVADSILAVAPRITVLDAGGNHLRAGLVEVAICRWEGKQGGTHRAAEAWTDQADRRWHCANDQKEDPWDKRPLFLRGVTSRVPNDSGVVQFDSLAVIGGTANYRLRFSVAGCESCQEFSGIMTYDAGVIYDRSFLVISAIKSVAGLKPESEFFDFRFRFRLPHGFAVSLSSDLGLTRNGEADSTGVSSSDRRLVDATVQLNRDLPWFLVDDPLTERPERQPFVGGEFRIFGSVPYMGVHLGNFELSGSTLHGSSLTVGYANAMDVTPVLMGNTVVRPSRHNIAVDGFLRSSAIGFLKYLNIRGTLMIPLAEGRRPESRIVISVPVGDLILF